MQKKLYKTVIYFPGSLPNYSMHSEPEFYKKTSSLTASKTAEREKACYISFSLNVYIKFIL